ncbi:MAG: hypothetical protein HZB44_09975 [Actinobacteria bacterium]|nr:hypothetical protein [Actinomycetota bacterium]
MLTSFVNNLNLEPVSGKVAKRLTLAALAFILLFPLGCTSEEPDTSAPRRQIIERPADWQGALLYIADKAGPNPAFGSIRIYDNTTGFVEKTVDQSVAAAPAEMYVTPDGGTMYVAGSENGRIDRFRWDGNNWIRGGVTIDTPASAILAMASAPGGMLYFTASDGESSGKIYQLEMSVDSVDKEPLSVLQLSEIRGIAWSPDGNTVFLSGIGQDRMGQLLIARWPSLENLGQVGLSGASEVNQAVTSVDGSRIYVMAAGRIYIVEPGTFSVTGTIEPSGSVQTIYTDGALSADGRYLFVTGNQAGEQASLYVIDLTSYSLVKKVGHVADIAGGMQRAE